MPTFSYIAQDGNGKTRKGMLEAESKQSLMMQLRRRGLLLTSFEAVTSNRSERRKISEIYIIKPKVKPKELMIFSRQLAAMLRSGMDLLECLDVLQLQSDSVTLRQAITAIKEDITEGQTFSDALARHPRIFSDLYVSMMEAAQNTGSFSAPLDDLALMIQRTEEIRNNVKSALRMPLFTLGFAVILVFALIRFAVPAFIPIYGSAVELPRATRILISVSEAVQGIGGIAAALGIMLAVVGAKQLVRTERGKTFWDRTRYHIPVFGQLILKRNIALFSRTLGLLLRSGVEYLQALTIVADVPDDRIMKAVIEQAREAIRQGRDLADAFIESGVLPPMVTQMINSGSRTGRVPEMLGHVSQIYEQEVDGEVERLTDTLRPILIIMVGMMVGSIMIGLYMPIFSLGQQFISH